MQEFNTQHYSTHLLSRDVEGKDLLQLKIDLAESLPPSLHPGKNAKFECAHPIFFHPEGGL